ncbi:MAG: TIM barrel protein [Terriglobia bacterium]
MSLETPYEGSAANTSLPVRLKLGFDNYSIRALGWKAPRLLEYAFKAELDTVLFSDLDVYESHSDSYLAEIKCRAQDQGIEIHAGTGSICPSSNTFDRRFGTAEEHLALLIRIAQKVGSPVARCYLGNFKDRTVPGGIEGHLQQLLQVLKSARSRALDAGVKIAVENHAGDLQARELVTLIEEAGPDFVGATMDCGNATWTLEHPLHSLELLGPYAVTTGIRDSMIWEVEEGAQVQWTAVGEGLIDFQSYLARFAVLCPNTPIQLEIISGVPRTIPYLTNSFWKDFSTARAFEFAQFIKLAKQGTPLAPFQAPAAKDPKIAVQEYQLQQLESSIRYCKDRLGLGLRP